MSTVFGTGFENSPSFFETEISTRSLVYFRPPETGMRYFGASSKKQSIATAVDVWAGPVGTPAPSEFLIFQTGWQSEDKYRIKKWPFGFQGARIRHRQI